MYLPSKQEEDHQIKLLNINWLQDRCLPNWKIPKRLYRLKLILNVHIFSYSDITNIKLTPNGSRVATTSQRGTIIRIFLTENGKIWEELRVGYDICRILDLNFYE